MRGGQGGTGGIPAPSRPSLLYYRGSGHAVVAEAALAWPLDRLGPPCPLHISPGLGQAGGEDGWERAQCPTEMERASGQVLILPVGTSGTQPPHALTACSSAQRSH